MDATAKRLGTVLLACIVLSACGSGDEAPVLMNVRSTTTGPDEFAILPNKPLEIPQNLSSLPAPTPGAANRTDPSPRADAIAALGGRPDRAAPGGDVPSSDRGLLAYANRYGFGGDIRATLAAEDLEFRQRNNGRLLERWFSANVYFDAYEPQSLDQDAELERLRRGGVRNVSAPPAPTPGG
ncbi:conserved hypothetical protein [Dinoroseobacter shibae DFL 12 = DSM 16493]|jgi:hypothetical protein|uniref:DUF3035 domain-containing protein n=1 Tax=Dinoroseobacter shibae (strain DSM 16493 / NCIMB 14021 / DFL 12) TaxID=398580 RepID=A8LMD2_DINSH|nr:MULTISPECIES: DUF3035 domain-containing protein [Dinoroseobacter]ABV92109.1 conserved hypothetical protein [Dinoroseobacter shibae DFL 12 = DSM 16493]MDD9718903.1 DUF3035 domain-containing protein [Dinoroseobacter sp. PD6]URF47069.1 DUF3035 domain-containing protein [Dinoroseobacter shibae]URF51380.1 DUF3035 domain-containing protein [Dinoroseobacter shibae]